MELLIANGRVLCDLARQELSLPVRMLQALQAGEAAGGDKRGRLSAALKPVTTGDFLDIELRVDIRSKLLNELARLLEVWRTTRAPGLGN